MPCMLSAGSGTVSRGSPTRVSLTRPGPADNHMSNIHVTHIHTKHNISYLLIVYFLDMVVYKCVNVLKVFPSFKNLLEMIIEVPKK